VGCQPQESIKVSNKISGFTPTEPPAPVKGANGSEPVVDKTQAAVATPAGASAAQPGADTASFTGAALTLQKLSAAVAKAPVVDAGKVAAVKQSLQNGTYQIDAGRVADKILKSESELN